MSPKKRETWSYSAGVQGYTVRVYERRPGGLLYLAAYDPLAAEGRGGYRRRSLGHRDRKAAEREARGVAAALEQGAVGSGRPTLGYVLDLYRHHELATKKPATAKWLRQHLEGWETFLGRGKHLDDIGPHEWESYKRLRRSGAIDGRGKPVEPEKRRPVTPGTVNLGLDALTIVCNWATRWRVEGKPLLLRSPVHRLPYVDDANPRRAVWTYDRFEKILAKAESLTMQVEWHGKRNLTPAYLADILVITEGTGRRIGAVRQLRYQNLRLSEGEHGKIAWPADTDKSGKAWLTPISPAVRQRLLKVLRERPGLGAAPLFPAPRNLDEPVGRDTLERLLRRAERAAGVPRLPQDSFHGLRRKWVTERKHLPDVDVAKAGGWRSITTMKRSYQQADEAGVLEVILASRKLRDHGGTSA